MEQLPQHLKKYIVNQDYSKYTAIDHAVWRYVLRQLKNFLSKNAHESYLDGLKKTGIEIEQIPSIESISKKLEKFGWRALPVSGFIPPAAFMELQSLNVLPIASDMRSIDHLTYTPAPDIVHEAAGHAPILVNPEYAEYLRQYAQVAKKSIISKQDLDQYEAIRILSDVKENPHSTSEEIVTAEKNLVAVNKAITFVSEASQLSRMNWWTAEYGLIGDAHNPKIYGAGLLSSVGESKWCLSNKVKKIPLSLNCIEQSYDITEPQPQLFITPDFKTLTQVLHEMAATMAFKVGGESGLKKAIQSETVNTVQFENGLQISGTLTNYDKTDPEKISYLQFTGPTQLCYQDKEIKNHGKNYHQHGYGTPIGPLAQGQRFEDLKENQNYTLIYQSGVTVKGQLVKTQKISDGGFILTFTKASCFQNDKIYFKPEWGDFDVITGLKITSVFGGPADRIAYGEVSDFVAARVPTTKFSDKQKKRIEIYQKIRDYRKLTESTEKDFLSVFREAKDLFPNDWLIFLEIFEIASLKNFSTEFKNSLLQQLEQLKKDSKIKEPIEDGLRLADEVL